MLSSLFTKITSSNDSDQEHEETEGPEELEGLGELKHENITILHNLSDYVHIGLMNLKTLDLIDKTGELSVWTCQRPLNEEHVNNLFEQLLLNGTLYGVFSFLRDNNNNLALIDGQHRFKAYQLYFNHKRNNDPLFWNSLNEFVPIMIYDVDTLNISNNRCKHVFRALNNTLNIASYDPENIATTITDKLSNMFIFIKSKEESSKRLNRPFTDKRELYLSIYEYVQQIESDQLDDINIINNIVQKIINLNTTLMNEYNYVSLNKKIISLRLKNAKKCDAISEAIFKKAYSNSWMLGCFKECCWIQLLN